MNRYTIYDKRTGEIIKRLNCPFSELNNNLDENQDYIEGDFDDFDYYVDIKTKMPVKLNKSKRLEKTTEEELLIAEKIQEILRRQAIEELKKEGRIKNKED